MDPPSSPPNNFRRTWEEDWTKDRYKDWPWHSSSSLHLCYMLRDWHLESAFVYSSLWLNAKYIGVSAQSRQPNTDGNLFNLESESGRNAKKTMQKTELLAHSWLLFPCVCVWLNFMLDLLWHLNFHNWKRVWAVINVVHVIEVDWPERSWDPPAARVATQTQAQIWGDDGGEGVFKFHTTDGRACCIQVYTKKQLKPVTNISEGNHRISWPTHIICLLKIWMRLKNYWVQCPQQWLQLYSSLLQFFRIDGW